MEAARHRLRGYRQALATADLPFDPILVRDGNWQLLSGYEATLEPMSLPAPRSAIYANGLMAAGCYEALRELGLRIPADVAVIDYDDREIARHLHPPLTTGGLPGSRWRTAPDWGALPSLVIGQYGVVTHDRQALNGATAPEFMAWFGLENDWQGATLHRRSQPRSPRARGRRSFAARTKGWPEVSNSKPSLITRPLEI